MYTEAQIRNIARACHEALLAYGNMIGDTSMVPWESAPLTQIEAAYAGVRLALDGMTPQELHDRWLERKRQDGWTLGAKNAVLKTHPSMKPWNDLPEVQRRQDTLFFAVVQAMRSVIA